MVFIAQRGRDFLKRNILPVMVGYIADNPIGRRVLGILAGLQAHGLQHGVAGGVQYALLLVNGMRIAVDEVFLYQKLRKAVRREDISIHRAVSNLRDKRRDEAPGEIDDHRAGDGF